ncbi:hypothetical protein WDU94_006524 [Cyamophila willieti]
MSQAVTGQVNDPTQTWSSEKRQHPRETQFRRKDITLVVCPRKTHLPTHLINPIWKDNFEPRSNPTDQQTHNRLLTETQNKCRRENSRI